MKIFFLSSEYLSISFARNSTNTKSNKPKKPKREKPFFLANREMMESVSGTILKTSLQKMLHFINTESEASIIFTDLEKTEARFFQIFVLITMRYKLFESLLSPGCCDLFNKIFKKFEEKTVKLVVRGPIINKWTKKRYVWLNYQTIALADYAKRLYGPYKCMSIQVYDPYK